MKFNMNWLFCDYKFNVYMTFNMKCFISVQEALCEDNIQYKMFYFGITSIVCMIFNMKDLFSSLLGYQRVLLIQDL